jgi:uncharacterized membrane protein
MLGKAGKVISGVFLRGVVVVLPITLTIAVLVWFAMTMEDLLGGLMRYAAPDLKYWPGLGIVLGIGIIFAAGIIFSARIARRLLGRADDLLGRIPVVKSIYLSIRDLATFMSGDTQQGFSQVVAVQSQEMRLSGFVTTEDLQGLPGKSASDPLIGVYLPMSYGIGGYTVYLPKTLVQPLDMSLEDAMRITLSGGVSAAKKPRKGKTAKTDAAGKRDA